MDEAIWLNVHRFPLYTYGDFFLSGMFFDWSTWKLMLHTSLSDGKPNNNNWCKNVKIMILLILCMYACARVALMCFVHLALHIYISVFMTYMCSKTTIVTLNSDIPPGYRRRKTSHPNIAAVEIIFSQKLVWWLWCVGCWGRSKIAQSWRGGGVPFHQYSNNIFMLSYIYALTYQLPW